MKKYPLLAGLILSGAVFAAPHSARSAEVFIYYTPKGHEKLSLEDAKEVFTASQLSWKSGKSIVLIVPNYKDTDEKIFSAFSMMSKSQFTSRWRMKFFSGRARMPVQVSSHDEAMKTLHEVPEAVYIDFKSLPPAKLPEGIKEEKLSF